MVGKRTLVTGPVLILLFFLTHGLIVLLVLYPLAGDSWYAFFHDRHAPFEMTRRTFRRCFGGRPRSLLP